MPDLTDNHDLHKYEQGDESWTHSEDMEYIDDRLPLFGSESNRANFTPYFGSQYFSTDTGAVYEGDGNQWVKASRDYEEIGADRLTRGLNANGYDITNIDGLEFNTLLTDLDFDGRDITGVDVMDVNRLGSHLNASGYRITNVSEIEADRLGSNLDAYGNDIFDVGEFSADTLGDSLDANGNNITGVADLSADTLGSEHIENTTYTEEVNNLGSVSGSTTIDLNQGNVVVADLAGSTSFSITNASSDPAGNSVVIYLDGNYSVSWPSSVQWPNGEAPEDPTGNLEVTLISTDGGTTWRGRESGRDFA